MRTSDLNLLFTSDIQLILPDSIFFNRTKFMKDVIKSGKIFYGNRMHIDVAEVTREGTTSNL